MSRREPNMRVNGMSTRLLITALLVSAGAAQVAADPIGAPPADEATGLLGPAGLHGGKGYTVSQSISVSGGQWSAISADDQRLSSLAASRASGVRAPGIHAILKSWRGYLDPNPPGVRDAAGSPQAHSDDPQDPASDGDVRLAGNGVVPVPEPTSAMLGLIGLAGCACLRGRLSRAG